MSSNEEWIESPADSEFILDQLSNAVLADIAAAASPVLLGMLRSWPSRDGRGAAGVVCEAGIPVTGKLLHGLGLNVLDLTPLEGIGCMDTECRAKRLSCFLAASGDLLRILSPLAEPPLDDAATRRRLATACSRQSLPGIVLTEDHRSYFELDLSRKR